MGSETDKRWKGRKIDWLEIADMDSAVYELKPLNQQQVAILLMLLDYQKWTTRWENLALTKNELESYIGDIEYRLMLNEGGGMATKDDIRDGIYEAFNRLALQVASGSYSNLGFTTDEDGTVIPIPAGTESTVEDDPLTTDIREDWASQMGGAAKVSTQVALFIAKLDNAYGPVNGTPITSATDTKFLINSYFETDVTAMNLAIDAYYIYRGSNGRILFLTTDAIEQYLFCEGANELGIRKWTVDLSTWVTIRQAMFLELVAALADSFWSSAYTDGAAVPSTEYRAADCTPFDTETIVFSTADLVSTAFKTGGVINKNNHRVLLEVSGIVNDTNVGGTQDFFWKKDTTGALSFIGTATPAGTLQINSNWTAPTAAEVPYRADGIYKVTRDTVTSGATFLSIRRRLSSVQNNGSFTLKITDLGQI